VFDDVQEQQKEEQILRIPKVICSKNDVWVLKEVKIIRMFYKFTSE